MDAFCEEFLAGTSLAGDQDRRIAARDTAGQIEHSLDLVAAPNDALEPVAVRDLGPELDVFLFEPPQPERLLQRQPEFIAVEGFRDVVEGTLFHCLHRVLNRTVSRD